MCNDIALDAYRQRSRVSRKMASPLGLLQPQCKKKNPQCSSLADMYEATRARVIHTHIYMRQTRRGICPDE